MSNGSIGYSCKTLGITLKVRSNEQKTSKFNTSE